VGRFRSPGLLLCLSALFLVLGAYLQTVEVPVRITPDPSAADQYDLMHVMFPFALAFWGLSFAFFVSSLFVGDRKDLSAHDLNRPWLTKNLLASVGLAVVTVISVFLPWVIVRDVNSGPVHALSALKLLDEYYWSVDAVSMVLIAIILAFLYVPLLAFFERGKLGVGRAFLFFACGISIVLAIVSVLSVDPWYYTYGVLAWTVRATFEGVGMGLVIAVVSAAGFLVLGLNDAVILVRR
jgi:hypothetical protein